MTIEAALHAELVNDILLNEIKIGQFEVDEMWNTIKKTEKRVVDKIARKIFGLQEGLNPFWHLYSLSSLYI